VTGVPRTRGDEPMSESSKKVSRDNQDDEPATIRMTVRRRRGDEGWA
jgi:hypothetical protein